MGKLKNPVLSLGAEGTLADTLTFQRSRRTNIVRRKPVPANMRSLKQMYQRWLYQDYIEFWSTLTYAQKSAYRLEASRRHNTPLGEYLRERLTDLTDISLWLHLDLITAATTPDSSKEDNTCAVSGCCLRDGLIDLALYFDGINDAVACGNEASLHHDGEFTYITRVYCETFPAEAYFFCHRLAGAGALIWLRHVNGTLNATTRADGAVGLVQGNHTTPLTVKTWHLVGVSRNAANQIHVWLDAVPVLLGVTAGDMTDFDTPLFLGVSNVGLYHHGLMDEAVVYQRCLTTQDHLNAMERRWPLQ